MAEITEVTTSDIDAYLGQIILGVSLLIWSITSAIIFGSGVLNGLYYNPYSVFLILVVALPPIGAYFVVYSTFNIWKISVQESR